VPLELIPSGTNYDFIGKRQLALFVSGGLLLAALIAIPIQGVRLGIDFAGGTEIQLAFPPGAEVDEGILRAITNTIDGVEAPSVVRYGDLGANEFLIRFKGSINQQFEGEAGEASGEDLSEEVVAAKDRVVLLEQTIEGAVGPVEIERVDFVGPRVGAELRRDGLYALLLASFCIVLYIAFRFSSRFAPGAIVAVLHDLSITAGIFVILGLEFDLRILAAMLAILGYSLNDTIIIYDRIRENMELRTKADLPEVLNLSVNQTLARTVLTSATTMLALLSLFFLGGEVIRPFALAMIIGVIVGTYSSVYIASATLLLLEGRGDSRAKKKAA